jgi:hypothetical protein
MACPLLLQCMLGDILCLDLKVAGVSNSDIVLFLRRDTPTTVNKSQVYIKTVTFNTRFYHFYLRLHVSAVTMGHHHALYKI